MSQIINIILGAVILFAVVVLFLWVSSLAVSETFPAGRYFLLPYSLYKISGNVFLIYKESGLGDACSGDCSSCRAHCKDETK